LLIYFLVAFGIAWAFLSLAILAGYGFIPVPFSVFVTAGTLAPITAAVGVTAYESGRAGVRALLSQAIRWRVQLRWYVIALLGPVLIVLAAFLLSLLFAGPPLPAPPVKVWPSLPVLLVLLTIFATGEEVGWRGFALPRLQVRYGVLAASVIVGVIHAIWHIPAWFIPGAGYDSQPFPIFVAFTVALGVVFAWLYNHTGGSVLIVSMAHAAINTFPSVWGAALQTLPVALRGPNPIVFLAPVLVLVAIVASVLIKPRTRRTWF